MAAQDAKQNNWERLSSDYASDYAAMIRVFTSMASKPHVHLMTPPPLYRDGRYGMLQTAINTDLPRLVPQIATANGLPPPVNLFGLYERHCPVRAGTPGVPPNATDVYCDWIGCGGVDACHPDNRGYGEVAKAVRDAIVAAVSSVAAASPI